MRSLCQRVSLPLYPDDVGEIITHSAERTAHSAELKGHPITDGLFPLKSAQPPFTKGSYRKPDEKSPPFLKGDLVGFSLKIQLKLHEVKVGEGAEFTSELHLSRRVSCGAVTKINAGSNEHFGVVGGRPG